MTLYQLKIKAYNKITDKKDSCYELRFQSYRLYKTSISNASFAHNQQGQLSQCHVFILSLRIDRERYCLISAEPDSATEVMDKILFLDPYLPSFFSIVCNFLKLKYHLELGMYHQLMEQIIVFQLTHLFHKKL